MEEGARVKKGHILLRVDPTDYRRDVARVEAEIAQLRESVNFSLIKLDRSEKARAVEIAPAQELDQARHEAALSRAQLKAAEVALATARDRLRYTEIDAPFDGTVIQRNVQPGEVVVPGMTATMEGRPLLMLADMSVLLVKTDLNQIDVARVNEGPEGRGHPGRPARQEVHRRGHPGGGGGGDRQRARHLPGRGGAGRQAGPVGHQARA